MSTPPASTPPASAVPASTPPASTPPASAALATTPPASPASASAVPARTPPPGTPFDAVVLAGGEGRRLGGVSKAEVLVGDRMLLDHALAATAGARHVVVVGPDRLARPGVVTVLEDPPLGGPVAGVAAGLGALPGDDVPVLVLACDVPLAVRSVPALRSALDRSPGADGACLVEDGRRQTLVALYRGAALRRAVARVASGGGVHGCSVRRLVADLDLVEVVTEGDEALDADTWEAVARLTEIVTRRSS